jgi:hypothetical protein
MGLLWRILMETTFEKAHADEITGKVTTVDRLIINGHLTCLFPRGYFERFLSCEGVLLKDFRYYVAKATAKVKAHAIEMATKAGRPYISLTYSAKGKDQMAKMIAKRDGIREGLICVLSALEMGTSFDVQGNHRTQKLEVVRRGRRCLHLYFYYLDAEFGLMHVRLQTWFPFQIQVYVNGREWLARQLEKRGIAFDRYENSLLWVEDLKVVEALCERFRRRKWLGVLNAFARRINPWLPVISSRFAGQGYYWVIDECEIATDIMWRDRGRLQTILLDLFEHAIRAFSAEDVMRFLGRKLTGAFRGEVVSSRKAVSTDIRRRPEGVRIKHRVKANWIKMYDKWSVLRIETVINYPGEFKVLRVMETPRGRKKRRWMPMRKGVANLWRYVQVGKQSNERYLDALGQVPVRGKAIAELDSLCQSRIVQGKRYARFNPVSDDDCALFKAVMAGEHAINGFRNRGLCRRLYDKSPKSPDEARQRCTRVSRLITKLRGHGLVAKVPKSRLYRPTLRGQRLLSAAIRYREAGLPAALPVAA